MADKRIKRKIVWEETGVSEIIGTILMLSITVVLFSSIITFVGRMPGPQETLNVEVDCYVVPLNQNNWTEGVEFYMVHQGGKALDPMWIKIYIAVDNSLLTKMLPDGLQDMNGDGWMGVGEKWNITIHNIEAPTLDSDSTFSITVIHTEDNILVWQETLGQGYNFYAPVIVNMWIDSDLGTAEVDDPGPISYLDDFKVYAEIRDPEGFNPDQGLDVNNLWVNLSSIYGKNAPPVQLHDWFDDRDALNDDIYVAICDAPNRTWAPVGYHYFTFNASDNAGLTTERAKLFPVGMIVGENPQISVRGDNPETGRYEYIWFSDPEPINGESITIYSTIQNLGGGSAQVDIHFYDGEINSTHLIGTDYMLLHAQGERDATVSWEASPGGNHTIIVTAVVNATFAADNDVYDPDPSDNQNQTNLSVMPKILLVDDDAHLNDLSAGDTVSFMRASLEAADFEYDFVSVGAGDGPGYDYGDYPLEDYDVVVWMTGYREESVLTIDSGSMSTRTDDVANLMKYLEGNSTAGNGGSLWFISEGFWDEAVGDPGFTAFYENYLHVPVFPGLKVGLPEDLWGNGTHPVTDYFEDNPIMTETKLAGTADAWSWQDSDIPEPERIALNNSDRVFAITYDSDDYLADTIKDSRLLVQTWGFSRIQDTATQAQYTHRAIMWLGNITMKYTQDVAISEQTIEPETVFYKQNVTIKFVVRNNGFEDYNYSEGDNLWYLLRITDATGNDLIIPHLERIDYLGHGKDNTATIKYSWTPERIGYHRIVIKVDPYNYIEESNELNNEISSFWASGELFVQYRILVVDDDGSINNGGTYHNETKEVTNSLDYLNATGLYRYEYYRVNITDDGPAFDPETNGAGLSEYNAVIWVGGNTTNPLTAFDITNITQYMDIGGNFWYIGDGMWTDTNEFITDFQRDYLRISAVDGDQGMASSLLGVEDDPISHGMDYPCDTDPGADVLQPYLGGVGFTWQNDAMTRLNGVRFKGSPISNTTITYRAVTTAWLLSSLENDTAKAEFTFMVLRWFDKPENRIEARITDVDIWLSNDNPQLGSGYVIQATVHNTGGALGNLLVRFMDGDTQIGSDSISVSAGDTTTAEIIWVPLFAGQRTINIMVDPIAEVDEIFEWSNNNASRDVYVYFFWDDMENGSSKWAHSSTILLINGEEPLEYFYGTSLDTNIITDWDMDMSERLETIQDYDFYHSLDTAFWLQEPEAGIEVVGRTPVDVVFALDTSGSMVGSPMTNLITATQGFIDELSEQDRVAIWVFGDSTYDYDFDVDPGEGGFGWWTDEDPELLRPWAYMTEANKTVAKNAVGTLTANGGTCFYDTLGEAITYSLIYDSDASDMSRLEYVIGMTDGESNDDEAWTPNEVWGTSSMQWDYGIDKNKKGLINAPPMVYTIGLGIDHDPDYPEVGVDNPDWDRIGPDPLWYPIEYDLWNAADSTPSPEGKYGTNATTGDPLVGHYYYTQDPNALDDVFGSIFTLIGGDQLEGGENQTRSGFVGPMPQATVIFSETFPVYQNPWNGAGQDNVWTVAQGWGDADDVRVENIDVNNGNLPPSGGNHLVFNDADQGSNPPNAYDWAWIQVDLSGLTDCILSFYWQDDDGDNGEGGRVDFSTNAVNGNTGTWTNIRTFSNENENTWYRESYSIPNPACVATFSLRFSASSDSGQENFMYDDIMIISNIPPDDPTFVSHGGSTNPTGPSIIDDTPTLVWNYTDPDGDPQGGYIVSVFNDATDVQVWTSGYVYNSSTFAICTTNLMNGNTYYWECVVYDGYSWSGVAGGKGTWYFTVNLILNQPPSVPHHPYPLNSMGGVEAQVTLMWECEDPDVNDTLTYRLYLDTVNPPTTMVAATLLTNSSLRTLNADTIYYWYVIATDGYFNVTGPVWLFATVGAGTGIGGPSNDLGLSPPGINYNKTAVTDTFNLENQASAKLSFWHKYNMMPGANGGFLEIGWNSSGTWLWKYIIPANAYTGNLRASVDVRDSFGTRIFWCWNGVSSRGTFDWEYVQVNILDYVPITERDQVKVKFNYTQYGGGTGYGWYIDDVRVAVSRSNSAATIGTDQDLWALTTDEAHSGTHAWANFDPGTGDLKAGVDNYLMTTPIDLTNAKTAYLSAYFKFNMNQDSGAPPDGFRVEVSTDNGVTWTAINLGVRTSWGVSGTGFDSEDGNASDGKAYTGIGDSGEGNYLLDDYWVEANSLNRINIDLSSFSGNAIHIRFRLVTSAHPMYEHNNNHNQADPGFGGFYVDDVVVYGETILT